MKLMFAMNSNISDGIDIEPTYGIWTITDEFRDWLKQTQAAQAQSPLMTPTAPAPLPLGMTWDAFDLPINFYHALPRDEDEDFVWDGNWIEVGPDREAEVAAWEEKQQDMWNDVRVGSLRLLTRMDGGVQVFLSPRDEGIPKCTSLEIDISDQSQN